MNHTYLICHTTYLSTSVLISESVSNTNLSMSFSLGSRLRREPEPCLCRSLWDECPLAPWCLWVAWCPRGGTGSGSTPTGFTDTMGDSWLLSTHKQEPMLRVETCPLRRDGSDVRAVGLHKHGQLAALYQHKVPHDQMQSLSSETCGTSHCQSDTLFTGKLHSTYKFYVHVHKFSTLHLM